MSKFIIGLFLMSLAVFVCMSESILSSDDEPKGGKLDASLLNRNNNVNHLKVKKLAVLAEELAMGPI